jgi:hypothetical protein
MKDVILYEGILAKFILHISELYFICYRFSKFMNEQVQLVHIREPLAASFTHGAGRRRELHGAAARRRMGQQRAGAEGVARPALALDLGYRQRRLGMAGAAPARRRRHQASSKAAALA